MGELKLFLEVSSFMLTRVCHRIFSEPYVANKSKKIVIWVLLLLSGYLVSERGRRGTGLFFTVSVSFLTSNVLLIPFPAHKGSQTLSAPKYCPLITAFGLQLFSCPVWVWRLPTEGEEKALASDWCWYKPPKEEEGVLLVCSD